MYSTGTYPGTFEFMKSRSAEPRLLILRPKAWGLHGKRTQKVASLKCPTGIFPQRRLWRNSPSSSEYTFSRIELNRVDFELAADQPDAQHNMRSV